MDREKETDPISLFLAIAVIEEEQQTEYRSDWYGYGGEFWDWGCKVSIINLNNMILFSIPATASSTTMMCCCHIYNMASTTSTCKIYSVVAITIREICLSMATASYIYFRTCYRFAILINYSQGHK